MSYEYEGTQRKTSLILLLLLFIMGGLIFAGYQHRTEYYRETDPTGKYTAICSYRTYLSFIPMPMGQSSDKACFVKIVGRDGKNHGEIPVPMIQMADVKWLSNGAEVRNVGEWNFTTNTCYYWSEDETQIFVKK